MKCKKLAIDELVIDCTNKNKIVSEFSTIILAMSTYFFYTVFKDDEWG